MYSNTIRLYLKKILVGMALLAFVMPIQLFAETAESLKSKISDTTSGISALAEEISKYEKELVSIGNQKDSLANTIKTLELTKKKLEADIKLTQKKIDAKNVEISGLTVKISDTGETIDFNKKIVAKSFTSMNELDNMSIVESLLSSDSVSTALDAVDQIATLQGELHERIESLSNTKTNLETNKKASEKAKAELVTLSKQLSDQKKVVQSTTNEKSALLKETKNSETSYQKLLADRKAQKEALEREVAKLEEALRITIDPSSIPQPGNGILKYPLNSIFITQNFGKTEFATKSRIYTTGTHPGIDFRASVGTQVRASLSGIVVGSGDMETYCKSKYGKNDYGYGQWIMLKHPNGLSTLYAHLSLINVTQGQKISTGEIIGYSGNTGLSTGPHLHFGVYATDGVRVTNLPNTSSCPGVLYPLADQKAYLDPLLYL